MKTNWHNLGEKYRDSDVKCSAVAHFPRLAIFLSTMFYEALNLQLSLESVQCTLYDVQYIVNNCYILHALQCAIDKFAL